ncbi:MarR family transcriptional regulator [Leptospira langatensis]|uniref:MarR family transcriptional regulator n=1 Tax=Leptospira langatensis TaxID=2484983 RepID=A0A5F1ZWF9_9LEPT|nr:MarR family winged helix-turn-helix transcriptional regulator [Leptospira langatensis]TGJ98367.1 MarR family transcriptional regulator [Leptospira langatensis]TGL43281.1 MarR family transcriptional regulator [Leptospira langatensis]
MKQDRLLVLITVLRDQILDELKKDYSRFGLTNITPAMGAVLCALKSERPQSMKEIAKQILRDQSSVTPLVQKLVDLDLVIQERSSLDARESQVRLTAIGKNTRLKIIRAGRKMNARLYRGMSTGDRKSLISLLAQLKK